VRLRGSDRLLLCSFAALAAGSVGLKAAAGPPRDGFTDSRPGQIEDELQGRLRSQSFVTTIRRIPMRSVIILAQKGECRLGVRDARGGESFATVFARDARNIGPVRYVYEGRAYSEMPGIAVRWGRFRAELKSRLGLSANAPVPVALATSPACGRNDFGMDEVRLSN
jgi:hypothetical protein